MTSRQALAVVNARKLYPPPGGMLPSVALALFFWRKWKRSPTK
jgi:hypothetical protein